MTDATTLPEAVRGSWYRVDPSSDPTAGDGPEHQVVCFGADGSFRRFEPGSGSRKCVKNGDYTFDGNFLIVRGRRSQTYRVRRPTFWRWELEGKKNQFHLYRGFVDGDELKPVDDDVVRQVRLLPLRVRVEAAFDDDAIRHLVYRPEEGPGRMLANISVQQFDDRPSWIGIAPLVTGVDADGWEEIVRQSYLGTGPEGLDTDQGVVLQLFDSGQTRQLSES